MHAKIDGHCASIIKTGDGIMADRGPARRPFRSGLSYEPDLADRVGVLATLATLAWLVSIPVRRHRGARPAQPPAAVSGPGSGDEPDRADARGCRPGSDPLDLTGRDLRRTAWLAARWVAR